MKKTPKKKNDRTLFIAAVIVFALAVGLFVGSYARYYTQVSVTGSSMSTAAWSFTVNDQPSSLTLDLLASPCTVYNLVNGKIQPGSFGTCDLTLSAVGSDVDVAYEITFGSLTGMPPSTQFDWSIVPVVNNVEGSAVTGNATGTITAGQTAVYRIKWGWIYNSSSTGEYNQYAGQTLTFSGTTVTGWQVQPSQRYDSTYNPQPTP